MVSQPGVTATEDFLFKPVAIPDKEPKLVKNGSGRLNFAINDILTAMKSPDPKTALAQVFQTDAEKIYSEKFPFPPTDCASAAQAIGAMKDELESWKKKLAAGTTDRVGKRYVDALETRIGQFEAWRSQNTCDVKEQDAANQSLLDTASNLLSNQKEKSESASGSLTKSKNWIYWGVGGLVVVTVLVVIIKKSSK